MSISQILADRERKQRERAALSENHFWFHRNVKNPRMFAEICLVSGRYRWRIFDGVDNTEFSEGYEQSVTTAMRQVFAFFSQHNKGIL